MSTASIALPTRARARIRVLRRRLVLMILLGAGLVALYTLWFRDSSLVAVKTVEVKGAGAGEDGQRLKRELTAAAEEMTTLHVSQAALVKAARPFPLVREVKADPSFPNSLTIEIVERRPIALIGPGPIAVAGDGRILRGVPAKGLPLPSLPLAETPKGSWVGGPVAGQARMLGAAPPAVLRHVDHSFKGPSGIGVELDGGVDLLFATAARGGAEMARRDRSADRPGTGPARLCRPDGSPPSGGRRGQLHGAADRRRLPDGRAVGAGRRAAKPHADADCRPCVSAEPGHE